MTCGLCPAIRPRCSAACFIRSLSCRALPTPMFRTIFESFGRLSRFVAAELLRQGRNDFLVVLFVQPGCRLLSICVAAMTDRTSSDPTGDPITNGSGTGRLCRIQILLHATVGRRSRTSRFGFESSRMPGACSSSRTVPCCHRAGSERRRGSAFLVPGRSASRSRR